ncbi:hypothetical protein, partial [Microcoleus sp. Aus8_D3]
TASQKPGFCDNLAVSPTNLAKNPVSRPRNGESETGFFRQSFTFIQKLGKKPGFFATNRESETGFFRQSFTFIQKLSKNPVSLPPTANQKSHPQLVFAAKVR